jgi:hypothetical protein
MKSHKKQHKKKHKKRSIVRRKIRKNRSQFIKRSQGTNKIKQITKKQRKFSKKGGFIAPLIAAAHDLRCRTFLADKYTCSTPNSEQTVPISTNYQQIPVNTPRYIPQYRYQQ